VQRNALPRVRWNVCGRNPLCRAVVIGRFPRCRARTEAAPRAGATFQRSTAGPQRCPRAAKRGVSRPIAGEDCRYLSNTSASQRPIDTPPPRPARALQSTSHQRLLPARCGTVVELGRNPRSSSSAIAIGFGRGASTCSGSDSATPCRGGRFFMGEAVACGAPVRRKTGRRQATSRGFSDRGSRSRRAPAYPLGSVTAGSRNLLGLLSRYGLTTSDRYLLGGLSEHAGHQLAAAVDA
jgi:hypothetical protein